MPATSRSQQRLFGIVHAYKSGRLKKVSKRVREIAKHISDEDAEHFAKTRHSGLPERREGGEKDAFDLSSAIGRLAKFASKRREDYFEGEGEVESFTPSKTEGHDEIVFRDRDGNRYRISNNTELGKALNARIGDRIRAHGYKVRGTNVVHKVHLNVHGRGGWLERLPGERKEAASTKVVVYVNDTPNEFDSINEAAVFIASMKSVSVGGVSVPAEDIPVSRVKTLLGERQPEINGMKISYPAAGSGQEGQQQQQQDGSGVSDLVSAFKKLTGSYGTGSYGI